MVVKIEWQCVSINGGLCAKGEDLFNRESCFHREKGDKSWNLLQKTANTTNSCLPSFFSVWNIAFENLSAQTLNVLVFWYRWLVPFEHYGQTYNERCLRSWQMINFIVSFTGSGSVVGQIHGYKKSFTDGRGEGNICIAY